MTRPVDVAHSPSKNLLTITWADDVVSELPIPYVRGWCPCASCQGHGGSVWFREPDVEVTASEMREAGAYALNITFSDGHSSGIFSWEWLRQISPESEPAGPKYGVFHNGAFHPAGPRLDE